MKPRAGHRQRGHSADLTSLNYFSSSSLKHWSTGPWSFSGGLWAASRSWPTKNGTRTRTGRRSTAQSTAGMPLDTVSPSVTRYRYIFRDQPIVCAFFGVLWHPFSSALRNGCKRFQRLLSYKFLRKICTEWIFYGPEATRFVQRVIKFLVSLKPY